MSAEPTEDGQAAALEISQLGVRWLIGCAILTGFAVVLAFTDDGGTQLSPEHSNLAILIVPLVLIGISATAVVMWNALVTPSDRTGPTHTEACLILAVSLWTAMVLAITLGHSARLIETRINFPRDETLTYENVFLPIARAFRYQGRRGPDWNIQLMSFSHTISISREDYDAMLRRAGMSDAWEIVQPGIFCLRGDIEKSGAAIRLKHARNLPRGSIVACPADHGRYLHLTAV